MYSHIIVGFQHSVPGWRHGQMSEVTRIDLKEAVRRLGAKNTTPGLYGIPDRALVLDLKELGPRLHGECVPWAGPVSKSFAGFYGQGSKLNPHTLRQYGCSASSEQLYYWCWTDLRNQRLNRVSNLNNISIQWIKAHSRSLVNDVADELWRRCSGWAINCWAACRGYDSRTA